MGGGEEGGGGGVAANVSLAADNLTEKRNSVKCVK